MQSEYTISIQSQAMVASHLACSHLYRSRVGITAFSPGRSDKETLSLSSTTTGGSATSASALALLDTSPAICFPRGAFAAIP